MRSQGAGLDRGLATLPWPGIAGPQTGRCLCTWCWRDGAMQLKYLNRACPEHARNAA